MDITFFLIKSLEPTTGGVEAVCYSLGTYFKKKGFSVHYLSIHKTDNLKDDHVTYLPNTKLKSKKNFEFIHKMLSIWNTDFVILSQPLDCRYKLLDYVDCFPNKVKVISHIHNSLFGLYSQLPILRNFQLFNTKYLRGLSIKINRIRKKRLFNKLFQKSDSIVLLSETFKSEFEYFYTGNLSKLISISNPIKYNHLENIPDKENIIIYVGRIDTRQKRFQSVLKIWKLLNLRVNDYKLIIVGGGMELKKYKDIAKKLNLTNLEFVGFKEPSTYYSKSKICCMTSNYEGFGLVLVESMSFGCIPFAFESFSAVNDIIIDNINGRLIKPFDENSYANEIFSLLNDNVKLKRMQAEAIKTSYKFQVENIGEQWLRLFDRFI